MSQATCNHLQTHSPHTHAHYTPPSPTTPTPSATAFSTVSATLSALPVCSFAVELVGAYAVAVQVTLSGCDNADATDSAVVATALAAVIGALRRPRAAS